MGCDIHIFVEQKINNQWIKIEAPIFTSWDGLPCNIPFDWRHYIMFAVLAGVRNYGNILPISNSKGLPEDSFNINLHGCKDNYHSHSYLTVRELQEYDYDKIYRSDSIRNALGKLFFINLKEISDFAKSDIDSVRIVFYFDN